MHAFISVKVVSLDELLSDSYQFRLPYFQRAYAWQAAEVGRLLSDVANAMRSEQRARGYFLGKLMLAKAPDVAETSLVDGHQRVMSLTILFAVLRDLEVDPERRAGLHNLINSSRGPRLQSQDSLAEFCLRYVQADGATRIPLEEDTADLSETQNNIIENRNSLVTELGGTEWTVETRRELADFLTRKCCVIVASVEDEEDAWRFLRTEEETQVDFSAADRAKWSILSIVPASERRDCQKIWESCEALLGAADLHALLGHLRTMKWRRRSERPVEIDTIKGSKLHIPGRAREFFAGDLMPAARLLHALRRQPEDAGKAGMQVQISAYVEQMSWINSQLWVPAALAWLAQDRDSEQTLLFFKRIERLVWMMRIAGHDPTKQQGRIIQLLAEIDRSPEVASMRELEISHAIKDAALTNLRSTTFDSKHYASRVLRRISIVLGQDPGPVNPLTLTIEHILPRGFTQKSGWRKHFPTAKSVQAHAHRLGNLTFLTAAENQAADTLDWPDKRPILARSRLLLANRLGANAEWTADSIHKRTEELIQVLFEAWDLKP